MKDWKKDHPEKEYLKMMGKIDIYIDTDYGIWPSENVEEERRDDLRRRQQELMREVIEIEKEIHAIGGFSWDVDTLPPEYVESFKAGKRYIEAMRKREALKEK